MNKNNSQNLTKKTITKKNKTRKILIIEPSSTSSIPSSLFYEKIGDNKMHLKITSKNSKTVGMNKNNNDTDNDNKNEKVLPTGRLNEKLIDLMEKLSDIMLKNGEPFRSRAYQKAQETIMSYPTDILSPADLKGKPNIGDTIMEKIKEYVSTGTLLLLEREKNNPITVLSEVYGIGPKKAKELVDLGITSIPQLREHQNQLNDVQKVGLKYYEDILKRIPRSEIQEYESIFTDVFNKVATTGSAFEIVGSYRRGAETSGDIDVIITSDSPKVFIAFIDSLISIGVIENVLSRGQTKCLVVAKIPTYNTYRRVDFLYTSPEEYPFAVLYFTGSKIFNTVMRHQALEMGVTMNEHGLYSLQGKKKGDKVNHKFHNEKDIFDYLNLEYKSPQDRIDGRAVIKKVSSEKPNLSKENVTKTNSNETKETIKKNVTKKIKRNKTILIIESESDDKSKNKSNGENKGEDDKSKNIIKDFKKNGISVLQQCNENQLSSLLKEANKAYYNQEPLMTDNEYDIVKEFIEQKFPSNPAIVEVGAPVEKNKVSLPYHMGSMDKIKPDTNALPTWVKKYKGPYILSCKLDGVSGLYTTEGNVPKLYTRGDGKVGQDISHLIPYLRLPKKQGIVVRGEFIIAKAIFEKKYKAKFANPRNMVAGIINHKTINDAIHDVHFVAYEVIKPVSPPSDQFEFLSTIDIETVLYKTENVLSNELLSSTLVDWRENYVYEIDGIIVTDNKIYERKDGNPDYAFAFKMVLSDQVAEAKVVDVIWTASKDGYLKPRVQIEPIQLGGVRIEYATGFNGSFINDHKVGIGSVVELIRSGDVIPHIRKVVVPAEQAKMPSVSYKWNDTHVDILLENIETDETVKEKNITGFFRGIGVEGLSSGNISRIIHSGFDTVAKIIKMTVNDFLQVEGFKIKTATKLHDGIRDKLSESSLVTIMAASNLFGRGFSDKKLEMIMESYPDVLVSKENMEYKINKVSAIKGMARKTAEVFVERIPDFVDFVKDIGLVDKLNKSLVESIHKQPVDNSHPLFGKTIVITGFRDKVLEGFLKSVGAKLGSSVSKNTFVVLVKNDEVDIDLDSGKLLDAKKLGIPIMGLKLFNQKYVV